MPQSPARTMPRQHRRDGIRRAFTGIGLSTVVFVGSASCSAGAPVPSQAPSAIATPSALPIVSPSPISLTPAQELLATSDDPTACAVSFAGDLITDAVVLEQATQRFMHLPIPRAEGVVFGGWYGNPESAAARDIAQRINGSDVVTCDETRELTLFASWLTTDEATAAQAQVPILMYHQFTDKPEGEDNWLRANYYAIDGWRSDMTYIRDSGFYLPTWDELDAFIDGALWLPERSVIITDDDADATWLTMAVPIVDELQVLTTSFVITADRQAPSPSLWVQQRSHTNAMHQAGANGKGQMVNLTADEIAADLQTSAQVLGSAEVVAYPYGHYDDRSKQGVAAAGFTLAVTIEYGYVTVGADKLALPRLRMNFGMTTDELAAMIG